MAILTQKLPAEIGVEVEIDPHRPPDNGEQEELRSLFLEHHLLVIHSDGMTVDETVRICGCVATVLVEKGTPPEAYVSSARGDAVLPDVEIPWHTDMNFNEIPHIGASLYAEEIDQQSSPTWFASAARAAENLPDGLRNRVEPLVALHELPRLPKDDGTRSDAPVDAPVQVPATRHPVLWAHPVTGKPILFISERQAEQDQMIEGLDKEQERSILTELFGYLYAPDNTYEHKWQVGDLVIWDNLAIQHRRGSVSGRRTVRRLALVSEGAGEGDQYFKIQAMIKATRSVAAY
jgi:taurine dioxygenase